MEEKRLDEQLWHDTAFVPFWGTSQQIERLATLVGSCVEIVTESGNPREMVLETWLVVDYAVRDFLLSGFGLHGFCTDDFDLRELLLPRGFREVLNLLKRTISGQSSQRQGSEEPGLHRDYAPITATAAFLKHLAQHHRGILEGLEKARREFFEERHPEFAEWTAQGREYYIPAKRQQAQRVPEGWLDVASVFDEDWFKGAERLSKARNKAAHSYDAAAVADAFGITGPKKVSRVQAVCLELLEVLLGISSDAAGSGSVKSGEV